MDKINLQCFLRKGMTEQERLTRIRFLYRGYGKDFFELCQSSNLISSSEKERLTKEVCTEYVRQIIFPTLHHFSSGTFNFGELNNKSAKSFAKTVGRFDDKTYQELTAQIDSFEKHFDKEIERAEEGKGGK